MIYSEQEGYYLNLRAPLQQRLVQMDHSQPQPLDPNDWPEELSGIVKDMQGAPINVHKLMANNPALLKAWWAFRNHSVKGGALGQRNAELVILRVAVQMKSWYEWASHVDRAIQTGLTLEEINCLLKSEVEGNLSPEECSLIRAVDELTSDHQIRTESLSLLEKNYSNPQIMDLIAIHGMYLILGAMINTWGLALDEVVAERISGITDEASFLRAAARFNP